MVSDKENDGHWRSSGGGRGHRTVAHTADVNDEADGSVVGTLHIVPAKVVEVTGALPKAVARSGLEFGASRGKGRCRVVIDV